MGERKQQYDRARKTTRARTMADSAKQLESLLRQHNFRLIRETRHLVYRNREGKVFVCSKTPSDYRASHNMLTRLKLVIASPPRPEVVAISDFEREQAALVIQPQNKLPGLGGGKQKHSEGVGIYWEETEQPTIEQEAIRKEQQERARKNKEERRARKLAKQEEKTVLRAAREQERQRQQEQREIAAERIREQRKRERREPEDWERIASFPLHDAGDWLGQVLRDGKTRRFVINQTDGSTREEPGVLTYIQAQARTTQTDSKDKFVMEDPRFQGWYPLIVYKYYHFGIRFLQLHPLDVVTCGDDVVYAPWLNRISLNTVNPSALNGSWIRQPFSRWRRAQQASKQQRSSSKGTTDGVRCSCPLTS